MPGIGTTTTRADVAQATLTSQPMEWLPLLLSTRAPGSTHKILLYMAQNNK